MVWEAVLALWNLFQSCLKITCNHFLFPQCSFIDKHVWNLECSITKVATHRSAAGLDPLPRGLWSWFLCQLPMQPLAPRSNSVPPQSHQWHEISFWPPLNESDKCLLQDAVGTQMYKRGIFWISVHPFFREDSGNECKWMQTSSPDGRHKEALIQQCEHHWFLILEGGPWAPIRNGVRRREGIWQLGFAKELASEAGWFDLHFSSPQHLTVWVILVCTRWSALSQIGSSFSSLVSALSPNFGAVGGRESRFWNWTSPFLGFYGSSLQCRRQLRYLLPSRA